MSNDRVAAINNSGVVSSLIEHTHIETENVGIVNGTAHSAFIRADDHHMVAVYLKVRDVVE